MNFAVSQSFLRVFCCSILQIMQHLLKNGISPVTYCLVSHPNDHQGSLCHREISLDTRNLKTHLKKPYFSKSLHSKISDRFSLGHKNNIKLLMISAERIEATLHVATVQAAY